MDRMDFSFSFKKKPEGAGPAKANPFAAAEEQFNALRGCGLNLAGHHTLESLTNGQEPATFEQAPFAMLLALMGGSTEEGEPFSNDVWLWQPPEEPTPEDAAMVFMSVTRLSKGTLALDEFGAGVDEERGVAQVTFTLGGEATGAEFNPEEGNIALQAASAAAAMAAEAGEGARLAFTDVEGAGRVFVFLTEPELAELAETTGLEWGWME